MAENRFISDLHQGHGNCLRFDNRPFASLDEQDEVIIVNWNAVSSPKDDIWILGDFSWYGPEKTIEIFRQLKGHLHLIVGNHDKNLLKNYDVRQLFDSIDDYKDLYVSKKVSIALSHYPSPCYNKRLHGAYHLYGHVHNSFEDQFIRDVRKQLIKKYNQPCKMYNVGCMLPYMGFTPRTLEEIEIAHNDKF